MQKTGNNYSYQNNMNFQNFFENNSKEKKTKKIDQKVQELEENLKYIKEEISQLNLKTQVQHEQNPTTIDEIANATSHFFNRKVSSNEESSGDEREMNEFILINKEEEETPEDIGKDWTLIEDSQEIERKEKEVHVKSSQRYQEIEKRNQEAMERTKNYREKSRLRRETQEIKEKQREIELEKQRENKKTRKELMEHVEQKGAKFLNSITNTASSIGEYIGIKKKKTAEEKVLDGLKQIKEGIDEILQ